MAKRIFKSTKKVSSVKAVYRKWSEWDEGDVLVGTYKGSQTDSYDKPNWLIEVEDAMFSDAKAAKALIPKSGKKIVIGLNSSGKLDNAMEQVEVGNIVQIQYNGTNKLPKGHKYAGKDVHDIEVDIVEEDDGGKGGDEEDEEYENRTRGKDYEDDEETDDL